MRHPDYYPQDDDDLRIFAALLVVGILVLGTAAGVLAWSLVQASTSLLRH